MKKTAKSALSLLIALLMILPLFPFGILDAAAEDDDPGIITTVDDDPIEIISYIDNEGGDEENEAPEPIEEYNLWVGGTRVTSKNKDDILNDGGKAKFDRESCVLTLDDPVISDSKAFTSDYGSTFTARIYCTGMELTIAGSYSDPVMDTDYGARVSNTLTLAGDFTFRGHSIAIDTQDSLIVQSGELNAYARLYYAITADSNIYIFGAVRRLYAESPEDPIHIVGGESSVSKVHLYGLQKLTEQTDPNAEIAEPDETISKEFGLMVGSTQVTTDNMNDVLGDGKVRYEPGSDTLWLDDPTIPGSSGVEFDHHSYTAKISVQDMPLTVKGEYTLTSDVADFCFFGNGNQLVLDGEFNVHADHTGVYHDSLNTDPFYLTVYGKLTSIGGHDGVLAYKRGELHGEFVIDGGSTGIYGKIIHLTGSGTVTGGSGYGIGCTSNCTVNGDFQIGGRYGIDAFGWNRLKLGGNLRLRGEIAVVSHGEVELVDGTIEADGTSAGLYLNDKGPLIVDQGIETVTVHGGNLAVYCGELKLEKYVSVFAPEHPYFIAEYCSIYYPLTVGYRRATDVTFGRVYPLAVGKTLVTSLNKDRILEDGVAKFDPQTNTLTLNDTVIPEPYSDSGKTMMIISDGIDLTIQGNYTVPGGTADYSVVCIGGNLTLDGDFDFKGETYGVYCGKKLTLKGNLSLTGYYYGFYSRKGATVCGEDSEVTLRGGDAALKIINGLLNIEDDLYIETPERNYIRNNDVYDDSGQIAKRVVIKKTPHYGVWLGNVEATGKNRFDILGDGTAVYDPATSTLTLNEPEIPGTHTKSGGSGYYFMYRPAKIWADGVDLTIKGKYEIDDRDVSYGIAVTNGDLTLDGDFTFNTFHCGIACEGDLTLIGGKGVLIDLHYAGGTGILCRGEIILHGAIERLIVEAPVMCREGYTIVNGMEDHLQLTVPENGRFYYEAETIFDANNQQASRVVFENDFILVQGHRCTAIDENTTELSTGWYAAVGIIRNNNRLNVTGEVHLILDDHANFMLKSGIHLTGNNSLTIYGGSKSGGTLQITDPPQYCAGIGGNYQESSGTLTVNGGILQITVGNEGGAVIGGGRQGAGGPVTINGGKLDLRSNSSGMCIGAGFMASYCQTLTIGELSVRSYEDGTVPLAQRVAACRDSIAVHIEPCAAHSFTDHVCIYCGKTAAIGDILSGSGTDNDPYLISTTADWEELGYYIESGVETKDLYFRQTENISVTSAIGVSGNPFEGVYDGNCKILTLQSAGAPFSVGGATIRNLTTEGTVNGGIHCSGLIGGCRGNARIENCAVRVAITTSGGYCGGFIGHAGTNAVTIVGCVFDGSFSGATHAGTFWGWSDAGAKATIVDCVDLSDSSFPIGAGRNDLADGVYNVFYTAESKTPDSSRPWASTGSRVYRIEAGNTASLSFSSEVTEYAGSGLSFCGSTFSLGEDGVFYAPEGSTVSLYALAAGTAFTDGYLADLDPFVNGEFAMPAKNVTVNAVSGVAVTGYEDVQSAVGNNDEGAENLFDGDFSTKWCVSRISSPFHVTFRTESAIKPTGYLFVTAGDTARYPGRNPTAWTLEGSADGVNWTTLADVSGDATLGGYNGKTYVFALDETDAAYTFFRFTVNGVGSGTTTFQLAELRLFSEARIPGDINYDGEVTISDVTALLDILASGRRDASADLDKDGSITISDVTALLDLLSKNS